MMDAEQNESMDMSGVKREEGSGMSGGSMRGWRKFFKSLKKGVRSVNRFVQKVADAPGMDSNIYLQGASKLLNQTNSMMNPPSRDNTIPIAQAVKIEGSGYRGRGMLRM